MSESVNSYLCVDLETTGLNPKMDKIIEIGAVKVKDGEILSTFQTYVNPGKILSEEVSKLTGITQENLVGAPTIDKVLPDFLNFAEELPLLGHRVLFDFSFLKRAAVNHKLTFERSGIDTLRLSRKYLADLHSRRLCELCKHYGISLQAHRALEDAKATHFLYQRLCAEFYQEDDFRPYPLLYKVKRESPATKAQKERLSRLLSQHGITPDYEIEMLTKNEASRLIDRINAEYGILQNG